MHDHPGIGRRFFLLFGIGACAVCLSVEAAAVAELAKQPNNLALGKLGVAALYCFNACYNVGVDVGKRQLSPQVLSGN